MIPQKNTIQVEGIGGAVSRHMGIAQESLAHVMTVLANLYSNPVLAVIREYSTNAMDSHIAAGKGNVPIQVSLPSNILPIFTVEDFGTGLTEDEVYDIYASYGASTKRESNDFNGQLGFGCKSAFSYTDQFTVTSTKDGVVKTYVFSLDEDGIGSVTKMDDRMTDAPNGVKVSVPVKLSDISRFASTAKEFYKYWKVKPKGIEVAPPSEKLKITTASGNEVSVPYFGYMHNYSVLVVMGNVAYPAPNVVLEEIHKATNGQYRNMSMTVYVPMGAVSFTPSREELKVSPTLKNILLEAYNAVYDEVLKQVTEAMAAAPTYLAALNEAGRLKQNYERMYNLIERGLKYKGLSIADVERLPNPVLGFGKTGYRSGIGYVENTFRITNSLIYVVAENLQYSIFNGSPVVKGIKGRENRALRNALNHSSQGVCILVQSVAEIPKENDVWGIPVYTLDFVTEKYNPKTERTPVPRGLGLYTYLGPKTRLIDSLDKVPEKLLPDPKDPIVVVEMDGYRPANRHLANEDFAKVAYKLVTAKYRVVYGARKGNLERISKVYTVLKYEDVVAEVIEEAAKANPLSAKASYKIPSVNAHGLETLRNVFGGDTAGINDQTLVEVIKRAKKIRDEYQAILNAPKMITALDLLEHLKGEEHVRQLVYGLYTESLEVPHMDDVLSKYPLLIFLSHTGANIENVKDYVNAKEMYDSNV